MSILSNFDPMDFLVCNTCIRNGECEGTFCYGYEYEREQKGGKNMTNKEIVDTLKEMLSNLCEGCSGCKDKCLDYQVLEYLLKEKGGSK